MVAIRVDANEEIATGHIMRCMAIADKLRTNKKEVIFITADYSAEEFITLRGYSFICLETIWNNMDTEIEKMLDILKQKEIEVLIVDSYYVTYKYLEALEKVKKVFYIDDLNLFEYPVNTVINYSIYADKFNYRNQYSALGMHTKFLLGCKYAPLRSEFENIKYQIRENVSNILITTGGTDKINIAGILAAKLIESKKFDNINIHIVVGKFNTNKQFLDDLNKKYKNIILHTNVTEMAKLMVLCDITVSAGGTTLYELCACGIPTIAVSFADNQLDNVKTFDEKGLLVYAGDVRNDRDFVLEKIMRMIGKMMKDYTWRKEVSRRMRNQGIGNGAKRIAEKLLGRV